MTLFMTSMNRYQLILLFKVIVCILLSENGKSNPSIVANKLATINVRICAAQTCSIDNRSGAKKNRCDA